MRRDKAVCVRVCALPVRAVPSPQPRAVRPGFGGGGSVFPSPSLKAYCQQLPTVPSLLIATSAPSDS